MDTLVRGSIVLAMSLVLGACGTELQVSSEGSADASADSQAVAMCEGTGLEQAQLLSKAERLAAVFEARNDDVGRAVVATCIFDATDIQAPGGPPPLSDGDDVPPYDQIVIVVNPDGQARPFQALRDGRSREPEGPENARRVK